MKIDRTDIVGLGLLLATGVTFALGEAGLVQQALWPVPLMLALALAKGSAVALEFMVLRQAPPLWRRLVLGWLWGVLALVALAWVLAR